MERVPELDQEGTEAEPTRGTPAASPPALAIGSKGAASLTPTPNPTAMLKNAAPPRIHMFHLFGAVMPIAAILVVTELGGDPFARLVMSIGFGVLALCNIVLMWMVASPARFRPRVAEVLC